MNHSLDSMVYAWGPLLGEWAVEHQHLLVKDPTRLGWKCEVAGCRFFKAADEFDGIRILADGPKGTAMPDPSTVESRQDTYAGAGRGQGLSGPV